jgi:hypothetical protein
VNTFSILSDIGLLFGGVLDALAKFCKLYASNPSHLQDDMTADLFENVLKWIYLK